MPKLLLINPNMTESVTQLLAQAAAGVLDRSVSVTTVTAPFGAAYITGEHSLAVAGHATLQAREQAIAAHGNFDGCVIGCFGDPALQAIGEIANEPVTGLAEASMRIAARNGPFAIVTGGHGWREPLRRLAFSLGLLDHLVALETVDASGAQLKADPEWALTLLGAACRRAIDAAAAAGRAPQSIIIGGAGLFGYAAQLQPALSVPVLDSVLCGLQLAAERLREEGTTRDVIRAPAHPYTLALLRSRAEGSMLRGQRLKTIGGSPPDLSRLPAGCAFADRCSIATDVCRAAQPERIEVAPGHAARCLRTHELLTESV